MKAIFWFVVSLLCSIAIMSGSQNSIPRTPNIPPETLPGPFKPPAPNPNYPSARQRPLAITADKMTVAGKTVQYRGNVRVTTESVIVTADELDFDASTRSAKVAGNVAIQMRPPGSIVVPLSQ